MAQVEVVVVNNQTEVRVHSVDDPTNVEVRKVPNLVFSGHLVGVTPRDCIIIDTADQSADKLNFISLDLKAKPLRVSKYSIRLPKGAFTLGTALSPQEGRIAWAFHFMKKGGRYFYNSLCISRLDGSGMKHIGSIKIDSHLAKGVDVGGWDISNLAWSPDGKRVSFPYQGRLWIVPVE